MRRRDRFSTRHGFEPDDAEITVRKDAPPELRTAVVSIAYEAGLRPNSLRPIVCRVLRVREDPSNWSEYPNVDGEVHDLLDACEWFEVYNTIEAINENLARTGRFSRGSSDSRSPEDYFAEEINSYFRKKGIGWQLENGEVLVRGSEDFEKGLQAAEQLLEESDRTTAANELVEARHDLSRRPRPDITGAIQHALAALECVARDVSGMPKITLGELIKRNPDLVPPPLDKVITGIWGFASERGRHVREGRAPDMAEAELLVGIAASVVSYILRSENETE